ncbi:MAG TPA: response regulator [Clostridiales bacterium]|nr:response regulator [Clostridiales bacterium]
MDNLLVVSEIKSGLLLSMEKYLEDMSYSMLYVAAVIDDINNIRKQAVGAMLLYVDEKILAQTAELLYLKDYVLMEDIPVFTLGNAEDLNVLHDVFPKHIVRHEFLRPINVHVSKIAETIHEHIIEYRKLKKILVVDDSGSILRSIKGWLENKYSVFLANSGAMAIKYLTLNKPDLVLLDYEMPVVDGRQVLEMIRTETDFSDIPVIFLTKKGDKESIMSVRPLKPEGYLLKTLEPAQIVKAVDDFFEMRKGLL